MLELRYGLGDQHPRTLDEIGHAFNVTRERIRQIEHQALKKLRKLQESQRLREHYGWSAFEGRYDPKRDGSGVEDPSPIFP